MVDFNSLITAIKNNNRFKRNNDEDSFYRSFIFAGKEITQARLSNHGTHLWSWVKNSEYNPKDCKNNVCIVFNENGNFISNTVVKPNKYRNAATNPGGKPYDFVVFQYVYNCSVITPDDGDLINKAIREMETSGVYDDPIKGTKRHAGVYKLRPNQPIETIVSPYSKPKEIPSKVDRFEGDDYYSMLRKYREWNGQMYESKIYKNMKQVKRINESQLRAIVAESVKKVLKEHAMPDDSALDAAVNAYIQALPCEPRYMNGIDWEELGKQFADRLSDIAIESANNYRRKMDYSTKNSPIDGAEINGVFGA